MEGDNHNEGQKKTGLEDKHPKIEFCKHYFLGPFQFLILALSASEILLGYWMLEIDGSFESAYFERIVVGSLSITVLIAVLVIFCIIYCVKKNKNDFPHKH